MFALTVAHAATTTASSGPGWLGPLVLIIIGVLVGRVWGRWAGLRHLGESEFRQRWARVREIRRW